MSVFQYALEIRPSEFWEAYKVHAIIRTKRTSLEKSLGQFVVSGKSIYTLSEIDESLEFQTSLKGEQCVIKIDRETCQQVLLTEDFINKENSVSQNLLNVIIKQAFRETNLKQLGRSPRFFDVQNPVDLSRAGLMMWHGFKASAFQSEIGVTLAIDNVFKFMTTKTCLDRIYELREQAHTQHQFEYAVNLEFVGKSVIADWGNKRTYIVNEVDFSKNPENCIFEYNGGEISVAEYFAQAYQKEVRDPKQPLFRVQISDNEYFLPSEFCILDGVPDSIRKGPGMRDALARTRITPQEKIAKIQSMCSTLLQQKAMKDWGIQIEAEPVSIDSFVLNAPQIIASNQLIHCSEQALRKLPIQRSVDLKAQQWIMIYQNPAGGKGRSYYNIADSVYNNFVNACGQLKIKVEEPHFLEVENEGDREEVERGLLNFMMEGPKSVFRHPLVVLVVLSHENNYKMYKELFQEYKVPSQVVTVRNGAKFNMSKASNILRQINSKVGGDLFTMKFPAVLDTIKPMLIGIDVCHSGPSSIVGFAASINPELSQYFSEFIVQPKG